MEQIKGFNEAKFARSIVIVNVIIYVIFVAIVGVAAVLHAKYPLQHLFLYMELPLAVAGILYFSFGWRYFREKHYYVGAYLSSIPLYIGMLSISLANGGVSSDWYVFWYLSIVITGMMGFFAVYGHVALTVVFYGLSVAFAVKTHNIHYLGSWQRAMTTIAMLVEGFWMATLLRIIHTNKEELVSQLSARDVQQRLVLSSLADAVIAVDCNGKVSFFNNSAQEMTKWDAKSAMGVYYNAIYKLKDDHDKDLTALSDPLGQAIHKGQPFSTDKLYFINKKQQKVALSISAAPTYDADHAISGAVAIFRDISDQKALERERSEFISTASHEMRTPVAAIEGYLSMAANPKLAQIDDKARGFLIKAHEAALHLGRLFQDLLTASKIEDQGLTEHREIFDISQLVIKISDEMQIIAQQKNLKLQVHVGDQTAATGSLVVAPSVKVYADQGHVRDIVTNLIDNAIKYTSQGGVDVYIRSDNGSVLVAVADTGIGISKADQRHLFQKFYRASSVLTQEIGGTGLGLYIARNLIEFYGGRIWVESEPGRGSTFSFTLPIVK